MDQQEIGADAELADLPQQDIMADIAAGLDDIKHGRTVPAEVVLESIRAKLAAWQAKKALSQDGHDSADSPTSNR